MTLIEVVIAIVIMGIVGATLIGLLARMSSQSAANLLSIQRTSLAGAYLDEILARSFDCASPAAGRANFDCVSDYDGIDEAPTDRYGNTVANLGGFRVQVSAGPNAAGLGAIPAAETLLVRVRVTDPFGEQTVLGGFKTRHP